MTDILFLLYSCVHQLPLHDTADRKLIMSGDCADSMDTGSCYVVKIKFVVRWNGQMKCITVNKQDLLIRKLINFLRYSNANTSRVQGLLYMYIYGCITVYV